jgi:hypothetical protein
MNHCAGRTNDDPVLIDQRLLVALLEHATDALTCCRAGEDGVTIHSIIIATDRDQWLRYFNLLLRKSI